VSALHGGPRLKIVLTKEAFAEILRHHGEERRSTGRDAELARAAVAGDRFRGSWCAKCGGFGALFCFEGDYASVCCRCTIERIERLAGGGHTLPPSVLYLHWAADQELKAQARRARQKLSVRWDDLCRCRRCHGFLREKEVVYWRPAGSSRLYPVCAPCREILDSGREGLRETESKEVDFGE